jgi:hypothetical protein
VATLHITNGDSAGDKLRRIVTGAVVITADVLHHGPVPPIAGDAYYETRARVLGGDSGDARVREIRDGLARSDRAVSDAVSRGDDLVLWFEHDLFDQLLLIRTFDMLARLQATAPARAVASLICIDRFPGVDRFIGLGQLSVDQLATLRGSEQPVTAEHYALATEAWSAFRSPEPSALLAVATRLGAATASGRLQPLPFLGEALLRFFQDYPSTFNGLSLTEQLALETLSPSALPSDALFSATQAREARPFMGDSTFYDVIGALASAPVPLVTLNAEPAVRDARRRTAAITDAGRDVLAGRSDAVALNGIDLWRGGVHLAGRDRSPWRWDARRQTLVS